MINFTPMLVLMTVGLIAIIILANIHHLLKLAITAIIVFAVYKFAIYEDNKFKTIRIENREFVKDGGELICGGYFGDTLYVSKKRGWEIRSDRAIKNDRAIGFLGCVKSKD